MINRVKFVLDKNKLKNNLNTTTFEKMKNLEKKKHLMRQKRKKNR